MKRLTSLLSLVALAFYVAWPAYAGLTIKGALEAKDAELLSSKVDFASVRESMRPAVTARVETVIANALKKLGGVTGPLVDEIKARAAPKIVEGALNIIVKPETLIKIHAEGGRLKDAVEKVVADEVKTSAAGGGLGGLLGGGGAAPGGNNGSGGLLEKLGQAAEKLGIDPGKALGGLLDKKETDGASEPATLKSGSPPKYGIGNIKHAALNGPLGVSLGIARDAAAKDADVTVEMSFTGTDWKLTGLVPRL